MKRMSKEKYLDFVEDEIEDLMSQEPNHKNCEQLAWMLLIRDNLDGGSSGGRMGHSQRRSREWDDEDDDRYGVERGRGGRGDRDRSFRR